MQTISLEKSISQYYKLSWRQIKLYDECPRCFYNEMKLGIKRPGLDPDSFSLPKAVDKLVKDDFDFYRKQQEPHPIMVQNNIEEIGRASCRERV